VAAAVATAWTALQADLEALEAEAEGAGVARVRAPLVEMQDWPLG
jgi:hypothetical protein